MELRIHLWNVPFAEASWTICQTSKTCSVYPSFHWRHDCYINILLFVFVFLPQWKEAREKFEKAAELMDAEGRIKKTMWGQFWSSHQV